MKFLSPLCGAMKAYTVYIGVSEGQIFSGTHIVDLLYEAFAFGLWLLLKLGFDVELYTGVLSKKPLK